MNAAKIKILLLWLLIVTSLGNASATTPGATENRVWQKSLATVETRQVEPLQTLGRHQENEGAGYDFAPNSLLAAKGGGMQINIHPRAGELGGINITANLRPYRGPGGGHHVPAKSAFNGNPTYDLNAALAIPNAELVTLGVNHGLVSGSQQTLYRAFAQSGETLTWQAMQQIETQALVRGGMIPEMAEATVSQAIGALKAAGVTGPTRIPWGN